MVFPPEKKERPLLGKAPKIPQGTDFPRTPPWAHFLPPSAFSPGGEHSDTPTRGRL